jgi:hypothetical protein
MASGTLIVPPLGARCTLRFVRPSAWKVNSLKPDTKSCIALAYRTGVQTLPPARLFSSWVLQDHPYRMVDARVCRQVKDEALEAL